MPADLARADLPVEWQDTPPLEHPGRALNAWLYGELAKREPSLADRLHSQPGPKPFSVALIPGQADDRSGLTLRVAGYGPLAPAAEEIARGAERLLLDGRFLVPRGVPAVATDTWEGLVSHWLRPRERPTAVRLDFRTPATFHSRGLSLPLPLPEVVFSGLLNRWQAWSPLGLGDDASRMAAECSVISRHRLWSHSVKMQGRHAATLGWAVYSLVKPDPAYAGLLAVLGEFAAYAGVGQKTGMGLGAVNSEAPYLPRGARTSSR